MTERFSSVENAADIVVKDALTSEHNGNIADALFRISIALHRIAAALETGLCAPTS